jgi:hypothetical protein
MRFKGDKPVCGAVLAMLGESSGKGISGGGTQFAGRTGMGGPQV